jgi:hypothetical protein
MIPWLLEGGSDVESGSSEESEALHESEALNKSKVEEELEVLEASKDTGKCDSDIHIKEEYGSKMEMEGLDWFEDGIGVDDVVHRFSVLGEEGDSTPDTEIDDLIEECGDATNVVVMEGSYVAYAEEPKIRDSDEKSDDPDFEMQIWDMGRNLKR